MSLYLFTIKELFSKLIIIYFGDSFNLKLKLFIIQLIFFLKLHL